MSHQAGTETRPPWLTDERFARLRELAGTDSCLATVDDNSILGKAAMISDGSGHIALTEEGWRLLREFGGP